MPCQCALRAAFISFIAVQLASGQEHYTMNKLPTAGGNDSLGPNDWPGGCLGYAYNLVRPTQPGHRASLLYSLLGNVLVFETLQDASAYRELVTQVRSLLLLTETSVSGLLFIQFGHCVIEVDDCCESDW